ncbi:MAG: hypothetical protein Kow00123_09090 [Anaerolineales bacterium]
MEQIIYLEPTDDLPAIRDRLDWAEAKRVVLVLPKGHTALRNPVGLRLLARHAAAREMEIVLVTRDRLVADLAREQGIAVSRSVEGGQRVRSAAVPSVGAFTPLPSAAVPAATAPRVAPRAAGRGTRWGQMGVVLVLIAVVGLLLVGVAVVVLPSAEIIAQLPAVPLSESTLMQADARLTEMQPITAAVPARDIRVEVKETERVRVSGRKDVPDAKAQGEIVFSNKTDSEIEIPAGVVLATSTGVIVRFQTVETVTVPAGFGAKAVAKIEAVEPGLGGNVQPYVINRVEYPPGIGVAAVNEKPTSGGSVKSVPVVSNEDKARARAQLLQRVQQEAYLLLRDELQEQEFLLPETMVAIPISEVYDKFTDEPAEELTLDMIVVVKALAISGKDANALALQALERKVPQGMALVPRTLQFRPTEVKAVEEQRVIFVMEASGTAAPVVDETGILNAIRGKPVSWAAQYVQSALGLESPPEIRLRNGWLGRMPLLTMRMALHAPLPGESP